MRQLLWLSEWLVTTPHLTFPLGPLCADLLVVAITEQGSMNHWNSGKGCGESGHKPCCCSFCTGSGRIPSYIHFISSTMTMGFFFKFFFSENLDFA